MDFTKLLKGGSATLLPARLARASLAVFAGSLTCLVLLLLLPNRPALVQAAPLPRPLVAILSDTLFVQHTSATTHQMTVFANGQISDWFLSMPGCTPPCNHIDIDRQDITKTTVAVLFDQHGERVDVGSRGDFSPTVPITLDTTSKIPGYSEDTLAIYASKVLSYQIVQQTLATTTNNCVIMELAVNNTGQTPLTGGKLMFMMDIDVGLLEIGDNGAYDPTRRLIYATDYNDTNNYGFAMGISLLEGSLQGYGATLDNLPDYPDPFDDAHLRTEMITPTNPITGDFYTGGWNLVNWVTANLPDLPPGSSTQLSYGICAASAFGGSETQTIDQAIGDMLDNFDGQANLQVTKSALPPAGSALEAGAVITYSITISNTGSHHVNNIVVTDTVPAGTELVAYSVTQGDVTAGNGVITAAIGRLEPISLPVTLSIVVRVPETSSDGAVISNQAFVQSEPIITESNVVTHQVSSPSLLSVQKFASPAPTISPGETLTYTIVVSNAGPGYAPGVAISDPMPAELDFIAGSVVLEPPGLPTGSSPPDLASNLIISPGQSITVTLAARVKMPQINGTIITNTASVSSPRLPTTVSAMVTNTVLATPNIQIAKNGPVVAGVGETAIFTFTITNPGYTLLRNILVEDNNAGPASLVSGDTDGDGWLALDETWVYTAAYTILGTEPDPLVNTAVVTASDSLGEVVTATATHSTDLNFAPVLTMTKAGPATATVGQTVVFTFTIAHDPASDGSPITHVTVVDDVAGPASYQEGDGNGNTWLEAGETWVYTVSHTIRPTDTNPLVNTGSAEGEDQDGQPVPLVTATHTTSLSGFAPVLLLDKDGPANALPGETIVYTFTVIHCGFAGLCPVLSDRSPVSNVQIQDNLAAPVTYLDGDNGNGRLEWGEAWRYLANYTVPLAAPYILTNTAQVTGIDQNNQSLPPVFDTHETRVIRSPVLTLEVTGPVTATIGQTINFTFKIRHAGGDGSPVSSLVVFDTLAGLAHYVGGDNDDSQTLDLSETWVYSTTYTVPKIISNYLLNAGSVRGKDFNNLPVTVDGNYTVQLIWPNGLNTWFIPVIRKQY